MDQNSGIKCLMLREIWEIVNGVISSVKIGRIGFRL
jgi:hypothetical protein